MKINIYWYVNNWVFDVDSVCEKEPFVSGSSELLTYFAKKLGILNPKKKLIEVTFDNEIFDSQKFELKWINSVNNGNVYHHIDSDQYGWLCPMLLHFFKTPPIKIYIGMLDLGIAPKITKLKRTGLSIAEIALSGK